LPGVIHYIDDILIMTATREKHDRLMGIVLRRLADAGFAVNEAKSAFGKSSIPFLGHVVSGDGIRPDPAKLDALREIRPPRTLSELQSLMCFLNLLGHYIPQFATLVEPIRRVQRKFTLNGGWISKMLLNRYAHICCRCLSWHLLTQRLH
jgi:hypothetical protein